MFEFDTEAANPAKIKVIGVGGGGNNAVNRMIEENIGGVDFIAVNTDKQALVKSSAPTKIAIGEKITKGHGAGANPEVGMRAAEESQEEISANLKDADMVFITTGMGGGTGTGAAPVVAKIARDLNILTVGIVTKPFAFEGKKRMTQAENGILQLRDYVDSLIIIPNERLKHVTETRITLSSAFKLADDILCHGVQSVTELITGSGDINLDFADITSVMQKGGYAHMGVGVAEGKEKATEAARIAISSPLLETTIDGAKGIIINITASPDIGLDDIDIAAGLVSEQAAPDANIIWGYTLDQSLEDTMKVTVIATGFESHVTEEELAQQQAAASQVRPAPAAAPGSNPFGQKQQQTPYNTNYGTQRQPQQAAPQQQQQAAPQTNSNDSGISDDDFDDIMKILHNQN